MTEYIIDYLFGNSRFGTNRCPFVVSSQKNYYFYKTYLLCELIKRGQKTAGEWRSSDESIVYWRRKKGFVLKTTSIEGTRGFLQNGAVLWQV